MGVPTALPATALVPVTKAVREAVRPLTADLVVFRGQVFREREETVYGPDLTPKTKQPRKHTRKVLEPVDVELHVNALGVGILGIGAIAAGIAGWLLWDGIAGPGFQIFRGLKTSPYWRDQAANTRRCGELRTLIRQRRDIKKSPGCDEACKAQMDREIAIFEGEKEQIGCRF